VTVPCGEKSSRSSLSPVEEDRLPTYSFIKTFRRQSQSRSRTPGFKSPLRKPHLTIHRAINQNDRKLTVGLIEEIASQHIRKKATGRAMSRSERLPDDPAAHNRSRYLCTGLLPFVPGNLNYGLSGEQGNPRDSPEDCGSRKLAHDKAVRPNRGPAYAG
jgi:hypothetical protein